MDEIKVLFNAIIERLDVQGANIEQMKMDIARLQGDVTRLQGDVTRLQGDVTRLQGDVTRLQGDVTEIKDNISALKEGQLRQEKILERLSIRSIEHEAYIAELRRIK